MKAERITNETKTKWNSIKWPTKRNNNKQYQIMNKTNDDMKQ